HLDTDRCGCRIAVVRVRENEGHLFLARGAASICVDVECRANHGDAEFGAVFVLIGEYLGQEGCGVLTNEHSVFSHCGLAPRASAAGPVLAAGSCQFWRIFCPLMTTSADPLMVICLPSIVMSPFFFIVIVAEPVFSTISSPAVIAIFLPTFRD